MHFLFLLPQEKLGPAQATGRPQTGTRFAEKKYSGKKPGMRHAARFTGGDDASLKMSTGS